MSGPLSAEQPSRYRRPAALMLGVRLCASLALVGLSSCDTLTGKNDWLPEDARRARDVRPCCADLQAVLATERVVPGMHSLVAQSTHHDFGHGLAPFVIMALEAVPEDARIEVESLPRIKTWREGGSGMTHFADTVVLFFDSQGRSLESKLLDRWLQDTPVGFHLVQSFSVPHGAAWALVSSNPQRNGQVSFSRGRGANVAPIMLPQELVLTTYGNIIVLPLRTGKPPP